MNVHLSRSEAETIAIGRALGARLRAGDVVLLRGALGAGKTVFVRGLAEGLGCDPGSVTSPTFTIVQEYRGGTRLQHADLYRLSPLEVEELALDELVEDAVLAVEWPDRWADPPPATVVSLERAGEGRRITIEGPAGPPGHSTR